MKYCKKCGKELKEDSRFCTSCGEPISSSEATDSNEFINNENQINPVEVISVEKDESIRSIEASNTSYVEPMNSKQGSDYKASEHIEGPKDNYKKSKKKIIIPIVIVLIALIAIGGVLIKMNINSKTKAQGIIKIEKVDLSKYPEVKLSISAENYKDKLIESGFTLKEEDAFQKGLKLETDGQGKYNITYTTSDENATGKKNISLAYLQDGNESKAQSSYTAPEKTEESAVKSDDSSKSSNVVDTYDNNEVEIKKLMDDYEQNYIEAVRYKDTYYIRDLIDLSGNLMNDLTNTIKSYEEQEINEELIDYKVEDTKKISDTQYEVTTYEKFDIQYGKQDKQTYNEFKTTYVINKTELGFKIYSIKNITNLGSKSAN